MAAILKEYVDRVFARGFAYETGGAGGLHGLLTGRRCVGITLLGGPLSAFVQDGRWSAVQTLQDTHIFRSAGFQLLEHLHLSEIRPSTSSVRDCARRQFGAQPG